HRVWIALTTLGWPWRSRRKFRPHQQDMVGLAVERESLRARHGLQSLLDGKTCRTIFLDDGQCAVHLRTEGLHGGGIEHRAISPSAKRQGGEDFPRVCIQYDHVLRIAAGGEKNPVARIHSE